MVDRPYSTPRADGATLGRLGGLEPAEAGRGAKALWLAGPGYRAALFHLGALTRLNEVGMLAQLGTVGAVAGGSIIAALLARGVAWPLQGAYRDWPERVAEPMRAIARRNARARALLRRPLPGTAVEAALEERFARELAASLGGESAAGPRFVFGASGLTLSGLAAGWEESLEWELGGSAHPPGYRPDLVRETIAAVRTDLDAFGEAEQAVLENHGYLMADAALRARGLHVAGGILTHPPQPPHPRWIAEARVREALAASSRRTAVGRLRPRRAGRVARRRPEPASEQLTALLERHRPLLRYDSLESCRADSAATICGFADGGRCNSLHRADGTLIAAAAPAAGEPRLELDFLRGLSYPSGDPVRADDHLDECGGSHAGDAVGLHRRPGWADVAYGRARRDRDGGLWLQYWFFHYYFDRGWLGIESHEGDWTMLQLRLDAEGAPAEATLAQHGGAERLRWDQLEVMAAAEGPVAVFYPARGSHVPRPRAGTFVAPVLPDHSDGGGPLVRPRLVPIGDDGPGWVLWPGRWGATSRRESFEGTSPRGPREHAQWWDPLELHEEAHPWETAAVAGAPPPLRLRARREGGIAVVSYDLDPPGGGACEPARIVAAPFDDGPDPSACRPFTPEARTGSFALQLPGDREWRGVRAAVTSARGGVGETVSASFSNHGVEEERAG
jgi:hypothetical protein